MKIKKNYNLNTKTGLFVIGANHRSSSMSLRDKLKISKPKLPQFFDRLRKINIGNAIILSSIDITDIIFLAPVSSAENIKSEIIKLFAAHADATRAELTDQTYTLINRDAVRHLFSVISAIDAVLIGDNQILSDFDALAIRFADETTYVKSAAIPLPSPSVFVGVLTAIKIISDSLIA